MKNIIFNSIVMFSLIGFSAGCSNEKQSKTDGAAGQKGGDVVVARVNGSEITRLELEQAILSTLGKNAARRLDEKGRRKILESLVTSRAISMNAEKELTPEDKTLIKSKMAAYREQLLVKMYLAKHAGSMLVTQDMIKDYYDNHPERFGGKTIREYEMIVSRRKLQGNEKDSMIRALNIDRTGKNLKDWSESLIKQGHAVDYRQGRVMPGKMKPQMVKFLLSMKLGEISSLTFMDGFAYVARIKNETNVSPRPLAQVKDKIRKLLEPVEMKKAIKEVSEEVLRKVEVEYVKN